MDNYEPPDGRKIYRSALYQLHTNIPLRPNMWSHRPPQSFTLFMHWLSADGALAVNWKGWWSDGLMIVIIFSALAVTFSKRSTDAPGLVGRTVFVWSAAANLVATKIKIKKTHSLNMSEHWRQNKAYRLSALPLIVLKMYGIVSSLRQPSGHPGVWRQEAVN